jgi:hypothetical protein
MAQRDRLRAPKQGLALRIEAKRTELINCGDRTASNSTPSRLLGLQEHRGWKHGILVAFGAPRKDMELEPQSPGSLQGSHIGQTQPIGLVGGTGRIPLRLGMGHVAEGSHKPVVIPTLGEIMCIRLVRLLRKCAEPAVPMRRLPHLPASLLMVISPTRRALPKGGATDRPTRKRCSKARTIGIGK